MIDDGSYEFLAFSRPSPGVLLITINKPEKFNAAGPEDHRELAAVWRDVSDDEETKVAVITGAGKAFCAGGDIAHDAKAAGNFELVTATMRSAYDLVYNLVECEKPVISAINGVAVGAGLTTALLADISLIADDVRLTDGHVKIGIAAGDHSALIWPLLCGVARAKYYLLTADFISAREAAEMGLVSRCVPRASLMDEALGLAERLAAGPQYALRWTKRSINNWLRMTAPMFEASLAYEMLNLFSDDAREGFTAFLQKRSPSFPTGAHRGTERPRA